MLHFGAFFYYKTLLESSDSNIEFTCVTIMNNQHTQHGHCIYFLPHVFGALIGVWLVFILIEPEKAQKLSLSCAVVTFVVLVACAIMLSRSFRLASQGQNTISYRICLYSVPLAAFISGMLLLYTIFTLAYPDKVHVNLTLQVKHERLKELGLDDNNIDLTPLFGMSNHQNLVGIAAKNDEPLFYKNLVNTLILMIIVVVFWIVSFEVCRIQTV